jgi:cytochrome c peroxidase
MPAGTGGERRVAITSLSTSSLQNHNLGRFKGPMLRDLAPRAPSFHNGFAADLDAVVDCYDTRFGIGFTKQEKSDMVAFLRTL